MDTADRRDNCYVYVTLMVFKNMLAHSIFEVVSKQMVGVWPESKVAMH